MKKFLFLAVFSLLSVLGFAPEAHAQKAVALTPNASSDTVIKSLTRTYTGNFSTDWANFRYMNVTIKVDKYSGTTSGTYRIEGSQTGLPGTWAVLNTQGSTYSGSLYNADTAYTYTIPAVVPYVRAVVVTDTNTQGNRITANAYLKY